MKLAPNPAEGNPPLFIKGEGDTATEFRSVPDPKKHVLAHVFKVVMDPFVGKMGIFRVHQGTVTRETQLYVGESRKSFKVGHLFMLQGGRYVEVDSAVPGDIAAVAKVDEVTFDCVLHDSHDEDHIHMRPLAFPVPMHGFAISPKRRGDEQRISEVLHKMTAEDPTLVAEHDPIVNETVLRGLGDLHLRSVFERMSSQFKLEVETRPPRVPYRETITAKAEGHHRHKKQTGGAGQFGEVYLKVEPLPRGSGFEFVDQVKGGAIPNTLIPAVKKGVEQVLTEGRSPASRCRMCASSSTTASITRWIRRKSRSSPRARRRSSTRSARRARSCSSPSSGSRSTARRARWATSPATCRRAAARSPARTRSRRACSPSAGSRRSPSSRATRRG